MADDHGEDVHMFKPRPVSTAPFVPDDFQVPEGPRTDLFAIEPLQGRHNKSDYEA